MASGLFLDPPLVLLRAAPFASTTATLAAALCQHSFIALFRHDFNKVNPPNKSYPKAKEYITEDSYFFPDIGCIAACITAITCVWNLRVRKPELVARGGAGWWFAIGGAFAAGRLLLKMWDKKREPDGVTQTESVSERRARMTSSVEMSIFTMTAIDFPAWLVCWYALARTCVST